MLSPDFYLPSSKKINEFMFLGSDREERKEGRERRRKRRREKSDLSGGVGGGGKLFKVYLCVRSSSIAPPNNLPI